MKTNKNQHKTHPTECGHCDKHPYTKPLTKVVATNCEGLIAASPIGISLSKSTLLNYKYEEVTSASAALNIGIETGTGVETNAKKLDNSMLWDEDCGDAFAGTSKFGDDW